MSELRKDPIIGRWIIISDQRKIFGNGEIQSVERTENPKCPFCVGNEGMTPPEIVSYRDPKTKPDSPGWRVRVVPNKFPALKVEDKVKRAGEGMYDKMTGTGAHEVIIETTNHCDSLAELPQEILSEVYFMYRERLNDLKKDDRFRYVLIFKNEGSLAGASLEHSHSQIISTPIVPKRVMEEMKGSLLYYNLKRRCIFCDLVAQDIDFPDRVIIETEHFISVEAFASRFPFETWIIPKEHYPFFENTPDNMIKDLANVMQRTLRALNKVLKNPPYNYVLHTSPVNYKFNEKSYHWHIEIIPKIGKIAGFEWGTGFYINPTYPENAAKYLKKALNEL